MTLSAKHCHVIDFKILKKSLGQPGWLYYIQKGPSYFSCLSFLCLHFNELTVVCLLPTGPVSPPGTRTVAGCQRERAGRWWGTQSKWPVRNQSNILPCGTGKKKLKRFTEFNFLHLHKHTVIQGEFNLPVHEERRHFTIMCRGVNYCL